MKTLIIFFLSLSLCHAQMPIELMQKRGLSRSGIAAAVQTGSTNLLTYSEDFSNAAWTKSDTTYSGGRIIEAATTAQHYIGMTGPSIATGSPLTLMAELKQDQRTFAWAMLADGADNRYVWYNLASCSVGTKAAQITATATAISDGWCRVTASITRLSTAASFPRFGPATEDNVSSYAGDASKGIYARRAQLNEGSTALPYVATTDLQSVVSLPPPTGSITRGANSGASTDDPTVSLAGWTFDSGDRVSGLPAKGANWTTTQCSGSECFTVDNTVDGELRRNLLLWSEDFGNAGWAKNTSALTVAAESDGTLVTITDSGGNPFIYQNGPLAAGGATYTGSVEIKLGTYAGPVRIMFYHGGSPVLTGTDDVRASLNASTYTRVTVSGTLPSDANGAIGFYPVGYGVNANGTIYIRNAQFELGSTPTAYQRTTVATGREYINGVARRNLLRWSEDFSNAVWVGDSGTWAADQITSGLNTTYPRQVVSRFDPNGTYTYSVKLKSLGANPVSLQLTYWNGAAWTSGPVITLGESYAVSSITFTLNSATALHVGLKIYAPGTPAIIGVDDPQLNLGSTALEYQKTTDSREWALETVGNYVGLLTWWSRYNRVLSPGEVLRNYRQWIKPQVNARTGNALP